MAIERVFLDWDGPCLPRAAAWLVERFGSDDQIDLSNLLLVTPGSRSGRRLIEILTGLAPGRPLWPPRVVTPGRLAETLCIPATPVADDLARLLARIACLRHADDQTLHQVVPVPPKPDDLAGWLNLAGDLQRLHDTLAAEGVTHQGVLTRCGGLLEFDDQERWKALARLQAAYEASLAQRGLADPHTALREAIEAGRVRDDATVVLVAAADLPGVLRRLLAHRGLQGHALIHAPAREAQAFDPVGCLIPDLWADRAVDLPDDMVHVVDRPRDQAHEALNILSRLASGPRSQVAGATPDEPVAPDQITLGLGDPALAPALERTLELAGVPARAAAGRPLQLSRPALLLDAWSRFIQRRRFDDFAALLRHSDIETYLLQTLGPGVRDAIAGWITLLDTYLSEHLQRSVPAHLLGTPRVSEPLKAVLDAVDALLDPEAGNPEAPRPLPHWSAAMVHALSLIYARQPLDRFNAADAPLVFALGALGDALREQAALDPADAATLRLALPDAITLTLRRLRDAAPPPAEPSGAAVEILGWLELQLDDAPHLIVTGVNEGAVPESVNHDAFLPDSIRRALALLDNRRRYARDLMALTAILHSRPFVRLIAGRRSAQDDPLTPSRLLLACPGKPLAQRVTAFYDRAGDTPAPPLLPAGERSRLLIPPPLPPSPPIDKLSVTAFGDYLACPYRFYLRHVCKLESLDDSAVEMSLPAFGGLAHGVLDDFGRNDLSASADPELIARFLSDALDRRARQAYGHTPNVAVTLQCEQLRQRLEAFARWQAAQAREGWRIVGPTERKLAATLAVDGQPFTIEGRIDRIDRHPDLGLRVVDYKTGDNGHSPEETHRDKDRWVDLQLPLYRVLVQAAGLGDTSELGYIVLPKRLGDVGLLAAPWTPDELDSALEEARRVIRAVRAGVFWPPTQPPEFDDGLGGICMDRALDRARVILESAPAANVATPAAPNPAAAPRPVKPSRGRPKR